MVKPTRVGLELKASKFESMLDDAASLVGYESGNKES